ADRVVNRFVCERQLRIDAIDMLRNPHTSLIDHIGNEDRAIADADRVNPNRRHWTTAIRLTLLLLDQLRDGPRLTVLFEVDNWFVHSEFVDRGILRDELQQFVAEADVVNRNDLTPFDI